MRTRTIALLVAATVGVGACGDSKDDTASTTATTEAPATSPSTSTAPSGSGSKTVAGLKISTDLSSKPAIPKPSGKAPAELVAEDVVTGSGTGVKAGDQIVVNYVGVLHTTGEQFDASWDAGRPYSFMLGQGNVIPGWDQGLEGMKVGGRRVLVIPPDLAYGDTGQGTIPPGATLIFVVDMLNATPA